MRDATCRVCAVCSTPIVDTDSRRLTCGAKECWERRRRVSDATVAAEYGCTIYELRQHRKAGEKYCKHCRTWQDATEYPRRARAGCLHRRGALHTGDAGRDGRAA